MSKTLRIRIRNTGCNCKQCGGSGMFIPDPTFFLPVSRILIKEFKYFNPKKQKNGF
jgi:hypothetical protein